MAKQAPILIIGDGAVGFAFAALIQRAGTAVILCGRDGISNKMFHVHHVDHSISSVRSLQHADVRDARLCFFTVKAYQLDDALVQWLPRLSPEAVIVSLCNGYVLNTFLNFGEKFFDKKNLRIGATTLGARLEQSDLYLTNPLAEVFWGPLSPNVIPSNDERFFFENIPACMWRDDPLPSLRFKWLANVCINSLCAYLNLPRNGDLLNHRNEVSEVLSEAYRLGETLWGAWPKKQSDYSIQISDLIHATAANENSMARDRRLGRKTEAEFMSGLSNNDPHYPFLNRLNSSLI